MNVFVSGCFDIIHSGHIIFLKSARALGESLTVSIAGSKSLMVHKNRKGALSEEDRKFLLESYDFVDRVVISNNTDKGINFKDEIKDLDIDILAVTEDDQYKSMKQAFCDEYNIQFIVMSKDSLPGGTSTTKIRQSISECKTVPLRVDFVGGWLDVPKYSMEEGYIINTTITPSVSLDSWPYNIGAGLGGSAAHAILNMKNGIESELDDGVGWQDPAVIMETGLCVWRSGKRPVLDGKLNPDFLSGRMAVYWTGSRSGECSGFTDVERDYSQIRYISSMVASILKKDPMVALNYGVNESYKVQLKEGMDKLPEFSRYNPTSYKYCGGGFGGYALYLFKRKSDRDKFVSDIPDAMKIEPYIKEY